MQFSIHRIRPLLVKNLVIVVRRHVVEVFYNYASTLIIYKVNRNFSFLPNTYFTHKYNIRNKTNLFILMENSKSIHELWRNSFLKKLRVMRHNFFYVPTVWNEKRAAPLCWRVFYFPSALCLYETHSPYEGGHFIAHSIFQTCVQQWKDYFGLFLKK